MEYEFRRELDGAAIALMSMGHEAFGRLLNDEGHRQEVLADWSTGVRSVQAGQSRAYRFDGAELTLKIEEDHVSVRAHGLDGGDELDIDPDLALYDAESEAICGLEDFLNLLASWRAFLTEGRR